MEQSSSEFPPETRRVLQVETRLLRGVGVDRPNTSNALPRKAIGGAPGSGASGYGRTWAHLIVFIGAGSSCFSCHTQLRTAESTKNAHMRSAYVRAEIQPHLLVHSDMGRSVVSLSRVLEYPCLASSWPIQNRLRNA